MSVSFNCRWNRNVKYQREGAFLNDLLLVGDDRGVVRVYDAEGTMQHEVSVSELLASP